MEKIKESIYECNEALKLDKNYLKAILRKAACHMELKEFERAVRDYERACKLDKSMQITNFICLFHNKYFMAPSL